MSAGSAIQPSTATWLAPLVALVWILAAAAPACAQTLMEEWPRIKAPPAPELKPATVDPKTTALMLIDLVKPICNAQRFAHCPGIIPAAKKLLDEARASGATVVHTSTLVPNIGQAELYPEVAVSGDEIFLQGYPDKFLRNDLEKKLKDKGITTLVTVGVAAQGGILDSDIEAAQMGFNIILPVDAIAAQDYYNEQFTVWDLSHAPVVANKTTLTSVGMIKFSSAAGAK
jgi:nicotinamidase-related amidase